MTVLLPSSVAQSNLPLLIAVVPAAAVAALAHPSWRHLPVIAAVSRSRHAGGVLAALLWLTAALVVLGVSLEKYHGNGCPNSVVFQLEISALARWVYELCARHNVPYWLVFGNILFVLRRQNRIPVGDTDSDIAIVKKDFFDRFGSVQNFTTVAQEDATRELGASVFIDYNPERELLQIFLNRELIGSHADIWFYEPEGKDARTGDPQWLVNRDRTIRAKEIPYSEIMPLAKDSAVFLDTPVTMPRHPEFLARAEYGASFMTPLTTRLECMENLWNGYTFYKTPGARAEFVVLVVLASSALAAATALAIPPLRRRLLRAIKKRRASSYPDPEERDAFLKDMA
ncbi:hypothetical protein ATCC90586_003401 [Pythium insidiosum]|nr:hypothetical protein ATCC90586_003401 [Pythium insidiosum]